MIMSKKEEHKEFESVLGKEFSGEFKERAIKLLPMARDFVSNREPDDVFEYTASMDPKDAYVLGLIIGRLLR